jgi:hypothetical protein
MAQPMVAPNSLNSPSWYGLNIGQGGLPISSGEVTHTEDIIEEMWDEMIQFPKFQFEQGFPDIRREGFDFEYGPIEFNFEYGHDIYLMVQKWGLLKTISKLTKKKDTEYRQFLLNFLSYKEHIEYRQRQQFIPVPLDEILFRTLTEDNFWEELDVIYTESVKISMNAVDPFTRRDFEPTNARSKAVIQKCDLFNPAWCVHYAYEKSDLEWITKPFKLNDHTVLEFRRKVRMLFDETSFRKPDLNDNIYQLRQGLNADLTHCINDTRFTNSIGIARRGQIHIRPGNYRDAMVINTGAYKRLMEIDAWVIQCLQQCEEDFVHRSAREDFKAGLKAFYRRDAYFLMRDMKKFGLTVPRELYEIILEELDRRCGTNFAGFYDYKLVDVDLKKFNKLKKERNLVEFSKGWENAFQDCITETYTPRGTGLGFHACLGSLIQIILSELIKQESFRLDPDSYENWNIAVYNDDYVARFKDIDAIEAYLNAESIVMKKLGLIRNEKKTFLTYGSLVLCERYYGVGKTFDWPHVDLYRQSNYVLCRSNIVEAKDLAKSLNEKGKRWACSQWEQWWGHEFYSGEWNSSYLLGGIFVSKKVTLREDLYNLEQTLKKRDLSKGEIRALYASKETLRLSPVQRVSTRTVLDLIISENIENIFDLDNFPDRSITQISRLAVKRKYHPEVRVRDYRRLYKMRQSAYERRYPGFLDLTEFYLEGVDAPLDNMIELVKCQMVSNLVVSSAVDTMRPVESLLMKGYHDRAVKSSWKCRCMPIDLIPKRINSRWEPVKEYNLIEIFDPNVKIKVPLKFTDFKNTFLTPLRHHVYATESRRFPRTHCYKMKERYIHPNVSIYNREFGYQGIFNRFHWSYEDIGIWRGLKSLDVELLEVEEDYDFKQDSDSEGYCTEDYLDKYTQILNKNEYKKELIPEIKHQAVERVRLPAEEVPGNDEKSEGQLSELGVPESPRQEFDLVDQTLLERQGFYPAGNPDAEKLNRELFNQFLNGFIELGDPRIHPSWLRYSNAIALRAATDLMQHEELDQELQNLVDSDESKESFVQASGWLEESSEESTDE